MTTSLSPESPAAVISPPRPRWNLSQRAGQFPVLAALAERVLICVAAGEPGKEDVLFAGGVWTLIHQPLLFLAALAVFCVLAFLLIVMLWRFVRRLFAPRSARPLP